MPSITSEDVLHAAEPIRASYDKTIADSIRDGQKLSELSAYSWALFSEMSLAVTPYEMFASE
jgi:hypothetical protein